MLKIDEKYYGNKDILSTQQLQSNITGFKMERHTYLIPSSNCSQLTSMSLSDTQHLQTVFVPLGEAASVKLQCEYTACLQSGSQFI